MLTDTQKRFYDENGFLVLRGVLSDAELAELREAADRLHDECHQLSRGERVAVIQDIIFRGEGFLKAARHSIFLAAIADLIGPDLELQSGMLNWKPPASMKSEVGWHQKFPGVPHSHRDWLVGMFPLDDATPETGCMRVIAGSHRRGPVEHWQEGQFKGFCQNPDDYTGEVDLIDIVVRAGDVTLHHCCLIHAAYPNRSTIPHRSLVFTVRPTDCIQLGGRVYQCSGFLLQGRGNALAR